MQFNHFNDKSKLNHAFAERIGLILKETIRKKGRAFLVVSGGKTPLELFQLLAKKDLEWAKVTITLADERLVDVNSSESNEYWVRSNLLQEKAAAANFISFCNHKDSQGVWFSELNQRINTLPDFDILILGMGEDGHTASLFPCSAELKEGLSCGEAVIYTKPQTARHARISMTPKRLNRSINLFLHITGEKKRQILQKAQIIANPLEMPISVFVTRKDTEVFYAP